MRKPDFLIIGAMKSGTTTLYHDLEMSPDIFFGVDKEPWFLARKLDLTVIKNKYRKLYNNATPSQLCGDASTGYTEIPRCMGVPKRAHELCGDELKLIYIVREPVRRIISQYYHEYTVGLVEVPINDAIKIYSRYVDYSSYRLQLEAWFQCFPKENILILKFEDYIKYRQKEYGKVCDFLGIKSNKVEIDKSVIENSASESLRFSGFARKIQHHSWYRKIRTALPANLRSWPGHIARATLGQKTSKTQILNQDSLDYLKLKLQPDIQELKKTVDFSLDDWL